MTRRTILATAASAFVIGAAHAADDTEKDKNKVDMEADRKFVLEAGLTEQEADCWRLAGELAGKFFDLPKMHPMDDHEIAHAIHIVQNKLLSRPTYREYLETAKKSKR
jgi:hypothetical protein